MVQPKMNSEDPKYSKIITKHSALIKKLEDDRIFCIESSDTGVDLVENCDNWYHHPLSKQECIELSEIFRELSELFA